jgi:hypothetical protein
MLETNKFLPHDQKSTVVIHDEIFENIKALLKIDASEIFSEYDSFIEFCENERIGWGPEIVIFPEVV